jgi:hypothetical protein
MFHRTAWLVRNPTITGRSRLWGEIGATVIDPLGGATASRRAMSRVTARPSDLVPSVWEWSEAQACYGTDERGGFEDADASPFLEVDLLGI